MTTTPFTVEQFGGLNLSADPYDVGPSGACDMANVRVDRPGVIITRGGFDTLNNTTLASVVGFISYRDSSAQVRHMSYSTSGQTVRVYDAGMAGHTDRTTVSGTFTGGAVAFEDGVFLARSDTSSLIVPRAVTPSTNAGIPRARLVGETGVEGRFVAAYAQIGGAPLKYRVHFSAIADLGTWGVTDYVDVWPFDGQSIKGLTTFRDQVFVFKDRRFAVFYGESIDADGGAIFNFRPVDVGVGCAYEHAAVTGPDGVYFIGADGIYRTVGDAPVLISAVLQPLFDSGTDSDWTGPTSIVTPRLYAAPDRLYFVNDAKVFAYHYASGAWTFDTYAPGVQFISQSPTGKARSVYFIDSAGKACEAGDTFADDDGTPVAWRYRSGRYGLGDAGTVEITRESSVVGSGTVTLAVTTDLYPAQSGTAVLGTAPAAAEGWPVGDQEGTWFQHTLSGSGAVRVSRLTHYVSSQKAASIR